VKSADEILASVKRFCQRTQKNAMRRTLDSDDWRRAFVIRKAKSLAFRPLRGPFLTP
jgi:hypothetical protein